MNKELKRKLLELNYQFDRVHYIQKNNRSLTSLFRMLVYNSVKYKERINKLQEDYTLINRIKIKIPYRELVACSIAAKHKKIGVFGTSHEMLHKSKYHRVLSSALSLLGEIGSRSLLTRCDNYIGKCAEVKAANNILKNEKKAILANIEFTSAIRPRSQEKIKRCINCTTVFGHE